MTEFNQNLANDIFLGSCKGVALVDRGPNDLHQCVQLLVEDDGIWHDAGNAGSTYWLDELIAKLQEAKAVLETHYDKDQDGYGYTRS